jgi:transcription termination factor Rho
MSFSTSKCVIKLAWLSSGGEISSCEQLVECFLFQKPHHVKCINSKLKTTKRRRLLDHIQPTHPTEMIEIGMENMSKRITEIMEDLILGSFREILRCVG